MTAKKTITAEEFDRRFDDGESEYPDWSSARRPGQELERVTIELPAWTLMRLDKEAQRLGVTRQALIKIWIAERLEKA
ncbi:MAG: ribbon-helix-helix protein, CopG family [Hoeflea sp.]|nr:ribbon-helix-helix protein, CopG family [Hoeflea sp.]